MALNQDQAYKLDRMNKRSRDAELGTQLKRASEYSTVKCVYDFSKQGGAVGSVNLKLLGQGEQEDAKVPDNAVITEVVFDVITAMASSGGTGTIALDSEGAGDLLLAVDADTLSGLNEGIPKSENTATWVKTTAERTLTATVATEDLTAGRVLVWVTYLESE